MLFDLQTPRRRRVVRVVFGGLALVFACGVTWLAFFARPAAVGFDAALRTGLYPFIPADILKIFVAAAVMPAAWRLIGTDNPKSLIPHP